MKQCCCKSKDYEKDKSDNNEFKDYAKYWRLTFKAEDYLDNVKEEVYSSEVSSLASGIIIAKKSTTGAK